MHIKEFLTDIWDVHHFTEIVTTSDLYYISVDTSEERDEWMDAIKKSSVSDCI